MIKKGLGKGIDALFGEANNSEEQSANAILEILLDEIDPNLEQPRKKFNQNELNNLADSMRSVGVIQPISVHRKGSRYMIIAGERRWRAAKLAGLSTIPALVRDIDKVHRLEIALIENLQREDLNPIEEAQGIRHLMDECGLTQEAVSKRIGKSRSAVANLLRLLNLPEQVIELVKDGKLTEGHARAIAGLTDEIQQIDMALETIQRGLNVRQCEQAVKKLSSPISEKEEVIDEESDISLRMLEEAAHRAYGVKASAHGNIEKGSITIFYSNRSELDMIYTSMQTQAGEV